MGRFWREVPSASVCVKYLHIILCSVSVADIANGESPIRHTIFWTATREIVHQSPIRVMRSVKDTWPMGETNGVCV